MKTPLVLLALSLAGWGCDNHASAPNNPPISNQVKPSGNWTGTENDRLGPAFLTWNLARTGDNLSGAVYLRPVDPADGSCGSCHKSKDGTISGTVSGTNIAITMTFPEGGEGDPTPACSITLNGAAAYATDSVITGTYTGSDPCEGLFDGTLSMKRTP